LTADQRSALDALVLAHLKAHSDDVQQSLSALPGSRDLADDLCSLAGGVPVSSRNADEQGTVDHHFASPNDSGPRYQVLRPHARGGLGEVFVALDQELHREVALKEIRAQHGDDPTSRGRFVQEAEITGGLEHPGVVPVYGLGWHSDGRPFYAMRLIRGE